MVNLDICISEGGIGQFYLASQPGCQGTPPDSEPAALVRRSTLDRLPDGYISPESDIKDDRPGNTISAPLQLN